MHVSAASTSKDNFNAELLPNFLWYTVKCKQITFLRRNWLLGQIFLWFCEVEMFGLLTGRQSDLCETLSQHDI